VKAPYEWIFGLERFQRDCRLGLQIVGGKVSLAFDDAIDFKIEIAKVLDGGFPKELHGQIENWQTTFLANKGGVSIEVRHAARPTQFLTLNARQMPLFSSGLQDFIDQAGQRG
jgi:hypothetical protein